MIITFISSYTFPYSAHAGQKRPLQDAKNTVTELLDYQEALAEVQQEENKKLLLEDYLETLDASLCLSNECEQPDPKQQFNKIHNMVLKRTALSHLAETAFFVSLLDDRATDCKSPGLPPSRKNKTALDDFKEASQVSLENASHGRSQNFNFKNALICQGFGEYGYKDNEPALLLPGFKKQLDGYRKKYKEIKNSKEALSEIKTSVYDTLTMIAIGVEAVKFQIGKVNEEIKNLSLERRDSDVLDDEEKSNENLDKIVELKEVHQAKLQKLLNYYYSLNPLAPLLLLDAKGPSPLKKSSSPLFSNLVSHYSASEAFLNGLETNQSISQNIHDEYLIQFEECMNEIPLHDSISVNQKAQLAGVCAHGRTMEVTEEYLKKWIPHWNALIQEKRTLVLGSSPANSNKKNELFLHSQVRFESLGLLSSISPENKDGSLSEATEKLLEMEHDRGVNWGYLPGWNGKSISEIVLGIGLCHISSGAAGGAIISHGLNDFLLKQSDLQRLKVGTFLGWNGYEQLRLALSDRTGALITYTIADLGLAGLFCNQVSSRSTLTQILLPKNGKETMHSLFFTKEGVRSLGYLGVKRVKDFTKLSGKHLSYFLSKVHLAVRNPLSALSGAAHVTLRPFKNLFRNFKSVVNEHRFAKKINRLRGVIDDTLPSPATKAAAQQDLLNALQKARNTNPKTIGQKIYEFGKITSFGTLNALTGIVVYLDSKSDFLISRLFSDEYPDLGTRWDIYKRKIAQVWEDPNYQVTMWSFAAIDFLLGYYAGSKNFSKMAWVVGGTAAAAWVGVSFYKNTLPDEEMLSLLFSYVGFLSLSKMLFLVTPTVAWTNRGLIRARVGKKVFDRELQAYIKTKGISMNMDEFRQYNSRIRSYTVGEFAPLHQNSKQAQKAYRRDDRYARARKDYELMKIGASDDFKHFLLERRKAQSAGKNSAWVWMRDNFFRAPVEISITAGITVGNHYLGTGVFGAGVEPIISGQRNPYQEGDGVIRDRNGSPYYHPEKDRSLSTIMSVAKPEDFSKDFYGYHFDYNTRLLEIARSFHKDMHWADDDKEMQEELEQLHEELVYKFNKLNGEQASLKDLKKNFD
tara:strand:- start:1120 stop:4377 length:3258 start_codon:yes stop_codon:yes gene_type:complete